MGSSLSLSLSLSLSFGIWVRSCDKKKGLRVEFWIPELLDDETCIYQLSKCRSLGARMFYPSTICLILMTLHLVPGIFARIGRSAPESCPS